VRHRRGQTVEPMPGLSGVAGDRDRLGTRTVRQWPTWCVSRACLGGRSLLDSPVTSPFKRWDQTSLRRRRAALGRVDDRRRMPMLVSDEMCSSANVPIRRSDAEAAPVPPGVLPRASEGREFSLRRVARRPRRGPRARVAASDLVVDMRRIGPPGASPGRQGLSAAHRAPDDAPTTRYRQRAVPARGLLPTSIAWPRG
jgi:hypothetical protein